MVSNGTLQSFKRNRTGLGSITRGSRHWDGCGGALLQLLLSFVEEEEASADVDVGRNAGYTDPCTPQTVNPIMMMLDARIFTCGKVADAAQRLMVQRSRTIRRMLLNWGAVGEVVESCLLAGLLGWGEFCGTWNAIITFLIQQVIMRCSYATRALDIR